MGRVGLAAALMGGDHSSHLHSLPIRCLSACSPPGVDASEARRLFPPQSTPRMRARGWSEVLRLKEMFVFALQRQVAQLEADALQPRKVQKVNPSAK